jgi:hypothetical protein
VDFRIDGRGVYSELAAVNGAFEIAGVQADGSVEVDAASAVLNEARLHLQSPPVGRFSPYLQLRRYRPYFELWTIWGAFSPIGFDEGRGGVTWSGPDDKLIVRGEASYRNYGQAGLAESLDDYRTHGWGLGTNIIWSLHPKWTANASYRLESGFGASGWDTQAGARLQLGEAGSIAFQGTAFERLYEFRLNGGVVLGLGAEASLPVNDRVHLFAGLSAYRHLGRGTDSGVDWNQRRASVRLQWSLGAEPGVGDRMGVPR